MNVSRRSFLQGVAGIAAGLILPPTLAENAEAVRRYWVLDRTMSGSTLTIPTAGYRVIGRQWEVESFWADGTSEVRIVEPHAPRFNVRIGRKEPIVGATVTDRTTNTLLTIYGDPYEQLFARRS
jgi:hypothetical protein